MKEALLYETLEKNVVLCHVCEHFCHIKDQQRGICGVRENQGGVLYALNYPLCIARSIDPIEKKPLHQFMPNTMTYSFATEGCNLHCLWCQNADIAKVPLQKHTIRGTVVTPKEHVKNAQRHHCPSIAYTYTEPTIFLEYALETMKIAHKEGLKNVWVSNGFMSEDTLRLIVPYLDAINIDYKAHNDAVYKEYTQGRASIVMRNMKLIKNASIHLEVTCLIIPGVNDETSQLTTMFKDIYDALGENQVLHISRFFGAYKMKETPRTSRETMDKAFKIAKSIGFHKVYLGNI